MALVIPIKAIYDADGKPIALGELQAGDKISLVYIEGAEASGSAAAAMAAHVAEPDPHGQYALEAVLGNAAYRHVGTALGTVAAGDDARLSDSREWTAATVLQADAEAGTDNTRKAWTALRVRQAIAAWWESVKASLVGPINITANSSSDALKITQVGAGNALVVEDAASPDSTPFVINSGGQVVIGGTTPRNIGVSPVFSLEGTDSGGTTWLITRNSADTSPSTFRALKTRGAANGAFNAVSSSDSILQLIAYGADGAAAQQAASIIFEVDGAVSAGIVPGKIVFYTTTSTGVLTEVCRMDSSQVLSLTSGKLKLALNAGATKLLQSDANGNASWGPAVGQADNALPTNSDLRAYYGVQYNPGILPTFELDFKNSRFSLYDAGADGVYSTSRHFDEFAAWFSTDMQIVRASTQTYFDALGNMREAPVNKARCDHDPLTGRKIGVYVGDLRVNKLYPSSGFSMSSSTPGGTITRGLLSLTEYTESTSSASRVATGIAGTAFWEIGVRRTLSVYAKIKSGSAQRYLIMRDDATRVGVAFDLVSGAVHSTGSGWSAESKNVGDGLFRMSATYTNTGASAQPALVALSASTSIGSITYTGDGVSGVWLGGLQGETGSISPLIVTTTSQVTRAATTITVSGAKFSGLFGFTEVTLVASAIANDLAFATDRRIALLSDGTINNRFSLHHNGTSVRVYANAGGTFLYGPAIGTVAESTPFTVAMAGKSGLYSAACNGVAAAAGAVAGFGTFDRLQIGYGATSQQLNGYVQSVALYPKALSPAQVKELSK